MHRGVILIGFQEQGNLGIGYLASTLTQHGFSVRILDFRERRELILEAIRSTKPLVVGFSLIFQYYLRQFNDLAAYLRENGVDSHFCAGGHYPSLRYEHVLRDVPALDSVVRFEGEGTLAELTRCLAEGRDWHKVVGIAYRDGDRCVAAPPRPLIEDLDEVPFPARPLESTLTVLGRKASPILASRGCSHNCSFCSIRQFYGQAPGKKVRVRNPARVVEEMRALYEEKGVSIFLFQDDDFPVWGRFGRRWVAQFLEALRTGGLWGRVIWKISCRSDEVEPEIFARMRDAGLYVVYLGIESGNEAGLQILNKRLTVGDSLRAITILRELGLAFTYGFMLFDPSSTFESVRENLVFLRRITADGTTPVVFCRMLPYAGTPIEERLAKEGRLRGSVDSPDYDFVDSRLNLYFEALNTCVTDWIQGADGLANQLNFAWQEYWVIRRLFPPVIGLQVYESFLRTLTRRCNGFLLHTVKGTLRAFETGAGQLPSAAEFQGAIKCFADQLLMSRDTFILRNQEVLMASLQAPTRKACTGATVATSA